ncbi:MAG TPA: FAD-binding oxidoreductase [Dehalococcoidia bacterium]|nr:FAD-binding oxidoreductase [Dehalococcoidia bacterium]
MGIVSDLAEIVGPDRVSTSDAVCLSYAFNCFMGKGIVRKPDIVVMPETAEEVSAILKVANRYKVPVTPKGAVGGAGHGGPLKGGILLDLALMDRIILIDATNMKAVAEAGCSFFKLSQELFKNGLMLPTAAYGPGPSVAASAITPANGFGETRYGANINLVEGFEVVLPSGETIRVGSMAYADSDFGPYYRYITGPDLVGLFTRSNGAFGIVTKVAYRCLHRPAHWAFHSYCWPLEKIEDVTKALMAVTAIEVFDAHLYDKWWLLGMGFTIPDDCHFALTVIVNAENQQELNGKEQSVKDICQTYGGASLPGIAENVHIIWPTYFCLMMAEPPPSAHTPTKKLRRYLYLVDELIYPTSKVPDVYTKVTEICQKHGLWDPPQAAGFDGFTMSPQVICSPIPIALDDSDPDMVERFHKAQGEFREWFGVMGGTFQYRLPPLVPEFVWTNQLSAFALLKSIKAVLDPNNILSPGTFELGEG